MLKPNYVCPAVALNVVIESLELALPVVPFSPVCKKSMKALIRWPKIPAPVLLY